MIPAPVGRETRARAALSLVVHDGRDVLRGMRRHPAPAVVGTLTIACGIAAVALVLSVVFGVLLRPLPWADADRVVRIYETRRGGTSQFGQFGPIVTNLTYHAWQDHGTTVDSLAAWGSVEHTLTGSGPAERVRGAFVTPSLHRVLGAMPVLGRGLQDEDADRDAHVVVVTHGFWQERLGGRPGAIGTTVTLDGTPYEVVGVMGPGVAFPDRATRLWLPHDGSPPSRTPGLEMFSAVARLRPGVTVAQAAAEATARASAVRDEHDTTGLTVFGSAGPAEVTLLPLLEDATREVKPALLVLLAAAALLLLAAAANVANVQLARAVVRRRELAIRSALGARPSALTRLIVLEGVLVGAAGAAMGLLVAVSALRALPSVLPAEFPRVEEIAAHWPALLASIGAALVAAMAASVVPAWQAGRTSLVELLSEDGLAPTGMSGRARGARMRAVVTASQVAIAMVLLCGAGLLARSFLALLHFERGFETSNVLTVELPLPARPTPEQTLAQRKAALQRLTERVSGVPGVLAVGHTSILPLTKSESISMMYYLDETGAPVTQRYAVRFVSPAYFTALGLRMLKGRPIGESDTETSQKVMVVNEAYAKAYLRGDPLSGRWQDGAGNVEGVVGVVANVRPTANSTPGPEVFYAAAQATEPPGGNPMLVIRTVGNPGPLTPILRGFLHEIDPALALGQVMTMEDRVLADIAKPRLYSIVLVGFALLALALAGVGLFGVLAYLVAQRSRELAVRAALGAPPRALLTLVIRQGLAVTAAGIVVGGGLAALLAGSIAPFLFGIGALDAATYAGVALVLLAVSLIACLAPALRAARLDPLVVLRRG